MLVHYLIFVFVETYKHRSIVENSNGPLLMYPTINPSLVNQISYTFYGTLRVIVRLVLERFFYCSLGTLDLNNRRNEHDRGRRLTRTSHEWFKSIYLQIPTCFAIAQLLSRALSAATESRNSVTKIKPNTPPLRLSCRSAERSLNVYVYGTTVRSSHGSRRAAPKSDEYTLVRVLSMAGGVRRPPPPDDASAAPHIPALMRSEAIDTQKGTQVKRAVRRSDTRRPPSSEHICEEPKVECVVLHEPDCDPTMDVIFVHGLYAQQSLARLRTAFGNEIPCKTTIYNWFAEFKSSRVNLRDEFRDGRPSTCEQQKHRCYARYGRDRQACDLLRNSGTLRHSHESNIINLTQTFGYEKAVLAMDPTKFN
ncbi:hypothetical protein EVAR_24452_1 [Eumeta japonica]|uniref:Mos1 transposase HTH domain-containing protein n=1 Tax=Eumeta variegata TaxID=151549 RepID=A0A4C1WUP7_EUMVA|nr:hypothetical protein EVAR_24452_1 [Eumeta japonica]